MSGIVRGVSGARLAVLSLTVLLALSAGYVAVNGAAVVWASDGPGLVAGGDRLPENWTVAGETPGGAALPGADPDRLNLYVQIHYAEGVETLTDEEKAQLVRIWAEMPVENADGSRGIDIHVDDAPPYGGELGERVVIEDVDERRAAADRYYTEEYLGPRHCVYHQVLVAEIDAGGYAGLADAPGMFAVVDGEWTGNYSGTVSYRVRAITHELLHNVVGTVPEEARGNGTIHSETGWLAKVNSDLDRHEHLSEPIAEQLSTEGFADPRTYRHQNCA